MRVYERNIAAVSFAGTSADESTEAVAYSSPWDPLVSSKRWGSRYSMLRWQQRAPCPLSLSSCHWHQASLKTETSALEFHNKRHLLTLLTL